MKYIANVPAGVVESVFGNGYGPGRYEVSQAVAAQMKQRGITIEEVADGASTDSIPNPVPPSNPVDLPAQGETKHYVHHGMPILHFHLTPVNKPEGGANSAQTGTQAALPKQGDLPDSFPSIAKLRDAEVKTYNDLRAVVDLKQLGLSTDEIAAIETSLKS